MLIAVCLMTACDKDGDTIYMADTPDLELNGNTSDIVLSLDAPDALVLTLYWNDNGELTTSSPLVDVPKNAIENTIQLAASADFTQIVEVAIDADVYQRQFTCKELNGLLTKLGFEAGVQAPLYVRIKGELAANITPTYSEALVINVTPYKVDTTVGRYLNSNKEDTGKTLYSPADNHVYEGFFGAGAWENWFLGEADGTIWGNDSDTGTAFVVSSASAAWNFWYPGISGCYYTVVNTPAKEWTALLIETISVSGDVNGEMVYDRKANQWSLSANLPAGTINITLSGTAKQYNVSTGTDDAAAIATTVGFAGTAEALTFNNASAGIAITMTIEAAGETALILDLNNPKAWTIATGEASEPNEEPADLLWVVGHNDGITGGWNFDSWLHLYNADNIAYGGVLNINSLWGYKLYAEKDNWDNAWGMAEGGSDTEGTLLVGGENITAPAAGLYVADMSIGTLSYHLYPITTVHYTGLNDNWDMHAMTPTSEPGVYSAVINKTANTPWGVKILINESWELFFGGGNGKMLLYQDGFDGDNDLSDGEHTLTVNLLEGTYSYE